jgi:hypothetical protein
MTSIVFTAPKHLTNGKVMNWAPGALYVHGQPHLLGDSDFVYVCHRNRILFRAQVEHICYRNERITTEGDDKGPGWVVEVADRHLPPKNVTYNSSHGFRYLYQGELW